MLPGLADGYVMAVALLVIGWVVAFGSEFHRSGERPSTFLLDLLHPLADLAVLGALLPVLTVAWRRVLVPYLALMVLTVADSLGVGARISGGHQGILEQLAMIAGGLPARCRALGADDRRAGCDLPVWRSDGHPPDGAGRRFTRGAAERRARWSRAGAPRRSWRRSAVVIAALVVIVNGLASAPATGLALVIAGRRGRARGRGYASSCWSGRTASRYGCGGSRADSLRDLADRTGDMVLICDLDGTITYASPP